MEHLELLENTEGNNLSEKTLVIIMYNYQLEKECKLISNAIKDVYPHKKIFLIKSDQFNGIKIEHI